MPTLLTARPARLDADEFDAMVEYGAFGDRRVFLWAGMLYERMARTGAHAFVEGTISDALRAVAPDPWLVRTGNLLRLGGRYVPLPDLVVLRGPWSQYRDRRAMPADVGLVVEIAVTSPAHDPGIEADEYARAGVAGYWVVDPLNRRVVEHGDPSADGIYTRLFEREAGDEIDVILDGEAVGRVAVADLF